MQNKKTFFYWCKIFPVILFLLMSGTFAQSEINNIGSFEQDLPSYWTKGNEPSGTTLSWATDESRSMGRSLKIEKTATGDSASWISENMVDLWSQRHYANVDIKLGAFIKTMGVNTNPANDDERWWVSYSFYDSAGSLIGVTKLPIDQSSATSSGWMADTSAVGQVILPRDSWKTIIKFVAGKNATGTVWADDFIFTGRGDWAGQDWNTAVGVPTGWFYWLPPVGGNDGVLSDGYENTRITNQEAHSGNYSLMFNPDGTHDGFVGTVKIPLDSDVKPGDVVRIQVWIKGENLFPDSVAAVGDQWSVAITPILHNTIGNNSGFGDFWASDIPLVFPNATSFDWRPFYVDVKILDDTKSISVRLHPLGRFKGTVYMDDLTVKKLDLPEINAIGSFEQDLPSYWTKGNEPGGTTLSWATDESRSMGHSLKIEKTATGDSASWISENMVDLWSPKHLANVDIKLGAFIKTMGVNTNPANDDERWWVSYSFYDSAGSLIGVTKLPIDQSSATSSGWMADTSAVGQVILPRDSWKTIIKFVAGKNATGTVWADDFIFTGRGDWAGQDWNTAVGVPTGWFYWLPPIGGNDGVLSDGYENTRITNQEAHSGNYSLMFNPDGTHDGFVSTVKFPLDSGATSNVIVDGTAMDIASLKGVEPGDSLDISVWIKGENLFPDSAAAVGDQWSVSITPMLHNTIGNNSGFGDFWASDIPLVFPNATSFDWTKFSVGVKVLDGTKSISVRLHPLGRFKGTVYMDDLEITKVGTATGVKEGQSTPVNYSLFQNYPNPFNPSTMIKYSIPANSFVTIKIYDMLGREVKTLVNGEKNVGTYNVVWNGENNFGSKVSSGTYIYRITAGNFAQVKKMILLK